jgi:hypothetical protein
MTNDEAEARANNHGMCVSGSAADGGVKEIVGC